MPALLMHLQGALKVQKDGRLVPPFVDAAIDARWAYQLGAFLVDLPLFEGFYRKVMLNLLHRPYPESRWGTVLHKRGSSSLVRALLNRAEGRHEKEVLALVAGLLTHIALDRTMHPLIEDAVARHVRPDETPAQLHEAIENFQSLRWHRKNQSSEGLGTAFLKFCVSVAPDRRPEMPSWLATIFRSSLGEVYGQSPTSRELRGWTTGICGYRDLLSTGLSRISIRSIEVFGQRRPWIETLELDDAFEEGLARAAEYISVVAEPDRNAPDEFVKIIGDGPLV